MLPCAFMMWLLPNSSLVPTVTRSDTDSIDVDDSTDISKHSQAIPVGTQILGILKNKLYICTVTCISCLYFIVTGIQFWMSDYLCTVLELKPELVFPTYAVVTVTGPTLGILMGGSAVHKIGGYRSNQVLTLCMAFGMAACGCAMPLPFLDSFPVFITLLWLVLFFGGGILPGATGVMLSSLKRRSRTLGTSVAAFINNILGFLPAPFLYGLVCDNTGGDKSRYGMMMLSYWSLLAQLFLSLAYVIKRDKEAKKAEI